MKRIGLAIAAAMLGTTGVASAAMSVHQFTLSSSASNQSVALDAKTENLAANCWVATGTGKAANCSTAASLPGVSVPGLSGLDAVTGLVKPQALLDEVKGVAGTAAGGTGVATQAAGTAGNVAGTAGNAAVNAATGAVNAATGAVNGVVNSATKTVNGVVNSATGVVNGAVNTVNGAVGTVSGVVNGATGTASTAVNGAVGGVTGVVNGVTGAVNNTLGSVTGTVNNVLGGGLLGGTSCSASGNASTGLLGVHVTGTC